MFIKVKRLKSSFRSKSFVLIAEVQGQNLIMILKLATNVEVKAIFLKNDS